MVTSRSILAGGLALAMLTAAACQQINDAIGSRDLECGEVPAAICERLADDIVGRWDPASAAREGPLVRVTVTPSGCAGVPNIPVVRCWDVDAGTASKPDGSGTGLRWTYFLRVDGTTMGPGDAVLGHWPVEPIES